MFANVRLFIKHALPCAIRIAPPAKFALRPVKSVLLPINEQCAILNTCWILSSSHTLAYIAAPPNSLVAVAIPFLAYNSLFKKELLTKCAAVIYLSALIARLFCAPVTSMVSAPCLLLILLAKLLHWISSTRPPATYSAAPVAEPLLRNLQSLITSFSIACA